MIKLQTYSHKGFIYAHIILTKFNYKWYSKTFDKNKNKINSIEWLNDRINLYEKYHLKSLLNQINNNFQCIQIWDKETPNEYFQKYTKYDFISIIHNLDWKKYVDLSNIDYLITSRLDNDDGISSEYIQEIQKICLADFQTKIVDSNGCRYIKDKDIFVDVNLVKCTSPFISVGSTKIDGFITAGDGQHTMLENKFKIKHKIDKCLFMQVIHERNLVNDDKSKITSKKDKYYRNIFDL